MIFGLLLLLFACVLGIVAQFSLFPVPIVALVGLVGAWFTVGGLIGLVLRYPNRRL